MRKMTTIDINADTLDILPVDKSNPTNNEIHMLETLFKQNNKEIGAILSNIKDIIILLILFVLFSVPEIDVLIKRYFQITQTSVYFLIFFKALLFCFSYFIIKNIYLARK